jgi:hypothetical protein
MVNDYKIGIISRELQLIAVRPIALQDCNDLNISPRLVKQVINGL